MQVIGKQQNDIIKIEILALISDRPKCGKEPEWSSWSICTATCGTGNLFQNTYDEDGKQCKIKIINTRKHLPLN